MATTVSCKDITCSDTSNKPTQTLHAVLHVCCAVLPPFLQTGQQRNVSLYVTHLLLDTAALIFVCRPMIELWLGLNEPAAAVRTGSWGFTYIVSCYALELTWRRRIDTMLAVHHVGTIIIILLYAGEFLVSFGAAAVELGRVPCYTTTGTLRA